MAERSWLALLAALVGATLLASTSCLSRRQADDGPRDSCTSCHGDARRAGEALLKAAPPNDLLGARATGYPGVGAHLLHLQASATHGPVACRECHRVPDRTDSPGHADDAGPAELDFGELARSNGAQPRYDFVTRRCSNSYCHAAAQAVWTEPRSSAAACGSCHGLPPPAPHPQSDRCFTCHGQVIDAERHFVAPELHVDGDVQLRAESCTQCHGQGNEPAPPFDTLGNDRRLARGVGAHAAHLSGGGAGRPLACRECHDVPEDASDFAHADGLPAEVRLVGPAQTDRPLARFDSRSTTCVDSWCHGPGAGSNSSPSWTSSRSLDCAGCHETPPAPPHPQVRACARCHGEIVSDDDRTIIDRARHVDGVVDVSLEQGCTACHGQDDAAPPLDTLGHEATSFRGVGAHRTHVLGTERSRAVPCAECHVVPTQVLAPGHVDSALPAELTFSGAALAFGAAPGFNGTTCTKTACHGAVFPRAHESGGSLKEPNWTLVDGSQAACGTCHGLPPPRPHPYYASDCGRCHENMTPDGRAFVRPELHVDGVVTFKLE